MNVATVPILLVSHNPYLRGILKFISETMLKTEVTELESEEKALLYLKNLTVFPSMIVYDYSPNAYLLEDFVLHLKHHCNKVKIIILIDKVTDEGKQILKEISQITLINKLELPYNLIEQVKENVHSPQFVNKSEYCHIELRFLSILDGINKTLYVRIGKEKFLKLFNEDDNTDSLDIHRYMTKGVENFYLKRETALWVIDQLQKQIDLFLRSNNFRFILRGANETPEKKFEQKILRINDEIHIDPDFREMINSAITKVRKVVESQNKINDMLGILKKNKSMLNYYTQKAQTTALISCLVAKQLDWSSRISIDKLVFASLLCDVTLALRPNLLRIQNLSEFEDMKENLSLEDQKIFLHHPKEGAELIKNYFSSAPPETEMLAYQHHELPDGSGFPHGLKADKISPLSALFIMSNHFTYYFLEDSDPSMEEYLLRAQYRFDYSNFRKIIKAFEKIKKVPSLK